MKLNKKWTRLFFECLVLGYISLASDKPCDRKHNGCCYGEVWNNTLKSCTACSTGFYGLNCKNVCPYPSYGKECQYRCWCSRKYCNAQYGCLKPSTHNLDYVTDRKGNTISRKTGHSKSNIHQYVSKDLNQTPSLRTNEIIQTDVMTIKGNKDAPLDSRSEGKIIFNFIIILACVILILIITHVLLTIKNVLKNRNIDINASRSVQH